MPRMNSIMERWIQALPPKLLDRRLIWNEPHLPYALRAYDRLDGLLLDYQNAA